jgi:hypothetical protein
MQPDAPRQLRGLYGAASRLVDRSIADRLQPLLSVTSLPRSDLRDSSIGVKFAFTTHGFDLGQYYHYGYDTTPLATIDPSFAEQLGMIDFSNAKPSDLTPILQSLDRGIRPITSTFVRRHHFGLDGVKTLGPFALRLDSAYDSDRVFYTRGLTGTTSAALATVLSLEYQTGEIGKTLLFETVHLHLFEPFAAHALLGYENDTLSLALLARWIFFDRLETELRATITPSPWSYMIRPEIGVKWNALSLRVGLLLLDGDPFSFSNYFRRNTSLFLIAKYSL